MSIEEHKKFFAEAKRKRDVGNLDLEEQRKWNAVVRNVKNDPVVISLIEMWGEAFAELFARLDEEHQTGIMKERRSDRLNRLQAVTAEIATKGRRKNILPGEGCRCKEEDGEKAGR